jgi:hypothetical protein
MTTPTVVAEDTGALPGSPARSDARRELRSFCLAGGFVVLNAFVLFGLPVPASNEYVYLLRLRALHDPSFLARDWTFAGTFPEHGVFNALFSPLTGIVSIEVLGWVGRVACWALLAALLLAIGRRLGLRAAPAAAALVLLMASQLRVVGQDWIFGTFEAKPVAYLFLFAALLLALRSSVVPALVAAGIALTLHPGVGVWASPALVAAMAVQPSTRRATLRWCWLAAVCALPGVLLVRDVGEASNSRDLWEFVTDAIHPFHLDPTYFGVANLVLLGVMLAANVGYAWHRSLHRDPDSPALRFVTYFQLFAALPTLGGVVAFAVGRYELLKYYPFRVFPMLVALFFWFTLAHAWGRRHELWGDRHDRRTASVLGLLAVTILGVGIIWNPARLYAFSARENLKAWTADDDDLDRALRWVRDNTPADAVLVVPPGADDTFYLSERAQVANVKAVRFEDIEEWRERVEAQFGAGFIDGVDELYGEDDLEPGFEALTTDDVLALERRFGAEYLLSRAEYDFDVLHRSGDYKVYELPGGP